MEVHYSAMVRVLVTAAILVYLVSLPVDGALTQAQRTTVLNLHNLRRSQVRPTAGNMLEMAWDERLAAVAENHAAKCRFEHSVAAERRQDYRDIGGPDTSIGENLYAHTSPDGNVAVQAGMDFFWSERNFYSYGENKCIGGRQCNHYTQMVWHNSKSLGCGMHRCARLPPFKPNSPAWNFVCMYAPAGNVYVQTVSGVVAQHPYIAAPSCSRCPNHWRTCRNNLCVLDDPTLISKVAGLERAVNALEQGIAGLPSKPSAHLNGGTNVITEIRGGDAVTFWSTVGGHIAGGFVYSARDGRLVVPRTGYYFVYAQIWNHETGKPVRHFVYANGRRLMVSGTRDGSSHTTWSGGVFRMNRGEGITVRLGRSADVRRTVWPGLAHTYFGAFML